MKLRKHRYSKNVAAGSWATALLKNGALIQNWLH